MNFEKALNLFFPTKCGICQKIGSPICNECQKILINQEINLVINENIWIRNKTVNNKKTKDKRIKIKKIFVYKYDYEIRKLLINYKFNDASYLANTFALLIKNNKKIYDILKTYDIIIPVPLHKKRKQERGYNQTELIAKKLGIKVETDCLIKVKNIKAQSQKGLQDRKNDIKNAYMLKNIEKIKGKKILIFDDIYTTGSTANECIKIISNITNQIGFMSIAKDYLK